MAEDGGIWLASEKIGGTVFGIGSVWITVVATRAHIHWGWFAAGLSIAVLGFIGLGVGIYGQYLRPHLQERGKGSSVIGHVDRPINVTDPVDIDARLSDHVVNRVIRSSDHAPVVHGRRFENCEIRGTIHLAGSHIENSKWLLGRFQAVSDVRSLPVGTLSFIDCQFDHCTFTDCTGVGTTEQVASLQAALGITGDQW